MRIAPAILLLAATTATTAPALALPGSTAADAAATVRGYYAAIDRGAFRNAYLAWDRSGQASGQSYARFRQGFAGTARTAVRTGPPSNPEGAAGSLYVRVPVDVYARLKNGRAQHFAGVYTLRRVNDVPGSTAADRGWHLYSARLRPAR